MQHMLQLQKDPAAAWTMSYLSNAGTMISLAIFQPIPVQLSDESWTAIGYKAHV